MTDPRIHICSHEGCDKFGPYGHADFKGGIRVTRYWCKAHLPSGEVVRLERSDLSESSTYQPVKKPAQGNLF